MLLSEKDSRLIKDYIRNFAPEEDREVISQQADLSYILRFWKEAKEEFLLKAFNGQLILEKQVDYVVPIEALEEHFISKLGENHGYGRHFYNDLYRLIMTTKELTEYLCYLMSYKDMLNNKWGGPENAEIPLPNDKKFKVNHNTKMTRILGKLAKAYNLSYWEEVRQAHAEVSTLKHTKGTLCLSIHPLDYMTMSDNEDGWDSCMSWENIGCYRAGTVEMMNSNCVIVAYLKSDRTLPNGWNSKLWRELYIVNKDLICNIRAYPYENVGLTKQVISWLRELCEKNCGYAYAKDVRVIESPSGEVKNSALRICFYTDVMYNDCGRNNQYCYINPEILAGPTYRINYSGVRNCMVCGEENYFDKNESLICDSCCESEERYICDCCGNTMSEEDTYYVDDTPLCYLCFEEKTTYAFDDPNEPHLIENCTPLYIRMPNGEVNEYYYVYIYDMYNDIPNKEFIETHEDRYIINWDKADNALLVECGFSLEEIKEWNKKITN